MSAALSAVTVMFLGYQEARELLRGSSLGRVAPVTWVISSALDSSTVDQNLKRRMLSRSRVRRHIRVLDPFTEILLYKAVSPAGSSVSGTLVTPLSKMLLQEALLPDFVASGSIGAWTSSGLSSVIHLSHTGAAVLSTMEHSNLGHLPGLRNRVLKVIMTVKFQFILDLSIF